MKKTLLVLLTFIVLLNNQLLNSQQGPCGAFNEVDSSPFASGTFPSDVVFSPLTNANALFAAASNQNSNSISVYSVNVSTGFLTPVTGSPFPSGSTPSSLSFSPLIPSNVLYVAVANSGSNSIDTFHVNPINGSLTSAGSISTGTNSPSWVVFSPLTSTNALFLAAFVTDGSGGGHIIIYSVNVGTGALTQVASSPVGAEGAINQLAISPFIAPNIFYIAAGNAANTAINVYSFNTSTNAFAAVGGPPVLSGDTVAVAFSPLIGTSLFAAAANNATGTVSIYSVNTSNGLFTLIGTRLTGDFPLSIAYSPLQGGSNLYAAVANLDSFISVYNVDTSSGAFTFISNYSLTSPPGNVTFSPLTAINTLFAGVSNVLANDVSIFSVDLGPIANNGSFAVCSHQPFSGTLSATQGGISPIANFFILSGPSHGSVTPPTSSGSFTYVSNIGYSGPDSFMFSVDDSNGCLSDPATETITVNALPIAIPESFSLCANQQFMGTLHATSSGGATITSYAISTPPAHGMINLIAATGAFTYTPNSGYSGPDSFMFTATDSNGCVSNPANVAITVNALPVAVPESFLVCTNQMFEGQLHATASGGATITSYAISTPPAHGTINLIAATGAFTYTPTSGYTGPDSFAFTVTDSNGCVSNPATVSITVNASPTADSGSFAVCSNQVLNGILHATASGGATITSFAIVTPPSHGTISLMPNSGVFAYIPDQGFSGSDFFAFTATDSNGCTSSAAIVGITVYSTPVITISVNPSAIVLGESAVLTAIPTAGTPPYQIIWSDGVIENNVFSTVTRTVTPQVTTSYSATVIDAHGCQSDPSNTVKLCVLTGSPLSNAIRLKYCGCR